MRLLHGSIAARAIVRLQHLPHVYGNSGQEGFEHPVQTAAGTQN
jgi:hypothetical protein